MNKISSVNQLPESPFKMPPPYWRGSSAIFHIVEALDSLIVLLNTLSSLYKETGRKLDVHYKRYPDETPSEKSLEVFSDICDELWRHEHKIQLKAEIAILMSAVAIEDEINCFCVFNLHKDISETIEKLSPPEKILILSAICCRNKKIKSDTVFESIKKLSSWRNAFVHGHCVDLPVKSLRHNHLISPDEYPGILDDLNDMQDLIFCFLTISSYLNSISKNQYTKMSSVHDHEIRVQLNKILKFNIQKIYRK